MDTRSTGLLVIGIGIVVVAVGLLVLSGALSWFGRLPGDIRIERGGNYLYIPITTMLVLSAGISLLLYLLRRFF
jgi:hypothetical protein